MFYELDFPFWAKINSTTLKIEKRPVGKINFVFEKDAKPARWRQLHKEGFPRPTTMKLDIAKHEYNHYSLVEFEDDNIEDFEGYDLIERREDPDPDDMNWLFPARGPG